MKNLLCAASPLGRFVSRLSILSALAIPTVALAQSAPDGIWATASTTSNSIYWNPVAGATGYNVYRGTVAGGQAATPIGTTSATSYGDNGLAAGTRYFYKVKAKYGTRESPLSEEVSAKPGSERKGAPAVAVFAGDSLTTLRYSAVPGATFYRIFRQEVNANWRLIATTRNQTYNDANVTNGIEYRYIVRGGNADTDLLDSSQASVVPGDAAPAQPSMIYAWPGSTSNTVAWNPVPGATGYTIYRGTVAGGTGSYPYATTTSASFTDSGLPTNTSYFYRVAAFDASGQGPVSPEISARVGATRLPAPYIIASAGDGVVTINWTSIPGATVYQLFRKAGDGNWEFMLRTTSTVFYDKAVANGSVYTYAVQAANADGSGTSSSNTTVKPGSRLLAGPTGLYAKAGNNAINLYWSPVEGATSYNLYRGVASGSERLYRTGLSTSFSDTVNNGERYYYRVKAVYRATEGLASQNTTAMAGATLLEGLRLSARVVNGRPTLFWPFVAGASSYNVYRYAPGQSWTTQKVSLRFDVTATYGSYIDTAAVSGVTYTYAVTPVNADSTGKNSNNASATAGNPPLTAPSGTWAISGSTSIAAYANPVPGASYYHVYRSTDPTNPGSVPFKVFTGSSIADYEVTPGTRYYYWFTAVDEDGESPLSVPASGTAAAPALPSTMVSAHSRATSIDIYWNSVPGATGYNIYRAVSGGSYTLFRNNYDGTSLVDTSAGTGQVFYYQIYAVGPDGMGSRSNTVSARAATKPLAAPFGLRATPYSGYSYVYWNSVPGATSYALYRSTSPDGQGMVPVAYTTSTAASDTNLVNGTTYYYRVVAVNVNGQGDRSTEVSVQPGSTIMTRVTLYAPSMSSGKVLLTWSKQFQATGYNVYRYIDGGSWQAVAMNVTGEGWLDGDVLPGAGYTYAVYPVNSKGEGYGSNTQRFVVP